MGRKKVCLFGTSADPPTGNCGHRGIVSALAALNEFDEVRVLPVYRHMFSSKRGKQAGFDDRMAMCRLAFGDIPKVTVSESERVCFERAAEGLSETERAKVRVGTADLLDMFLADEPDTDFSLALGSDTFMDLTNWKWRRSRDVLSLLQGRILVIYRLTNDTDSGLSGADVEFLEDRVRKVNKELEQQNEEGNAIRRQALGSDHEAKSVDELLAGESSVSMNTWTSRSAGNVRIIRIPSLSTVSSSLVRSNLGGPDILKWISPEVLDFIKEQKLYTFSESNM